MFEPSEKVIVLASSSKSRVGPKRGSVGYVKANSSKPQLARIHRGAKMCMSRVDLMFVRYGFSKERKKHESVLVINLFPILNTQPIDKVGKEAKNFLGAVKKQDFDAARWSILKGQCDVGTGTDVCVIAPIADWQMNVLNSNEVNFRAWFESVMQFSNFRHCLQKLTNRTLESKYPSNVRDYATVLRRCLADRTYKEDLLRTAVGNWSIKKRLVETVKFVSVVSMSSAIRTHKKNTNLGFIGRSYSQGSHPILSTIIPMLTKGVFSDHLFEYKCNLMVKYGITDNSIRNSMSKTKAVLRKEARTLFNIKTENRSTKFLEPVK